MIFSTLALAALLFSSKQDSAVEIPKAELPAKAECLICSTSGESHGPEKPAAGARYKGAKYYFCSRKELALFNGDPEMYVPPTLPRPAPPLSATTLEGSAVRLDDYKGKVVLVDFWATWCAPCITEIPHLNKLHRELAAKGFTVFGVSIDEEPKKVPKFLQKREVAYPVLLDSKTSPSWQAFKVGSIPALFLIDRDGQVVAQWRGKPDRKAIEASVRRLVGN